MSTASSSRLVRAAKVEFAVGLLLIFAAWLLAARICAIELHRRWTAPPEYVTNHEINIFEGGD